MLFLNTNGTVKSHQKISDTEGGFKGILDDGDHFGWVTSLGDLDGDGVGDLAVGAQNDDDGGTNRGAVYILFLDGICLWDLDANGSIGTSDLLELFAQWGTAGPADFDGSGAVGTSDLLILFANWGPCP
ncbi:MAG: FG-GAP repeat protein [Planctomycetes bacterium]|nr:FG-GAP repeat protein [Planctomycetota bacterium]